MEEDQRPNSSHKRRRCCLIFCGFSVGLILISGLVYWKFFTPPDPHVLMGSIQLGIQHSVGSLGSIPDGDLLAKDFEALETSQFPSKGGNNTLAHSFPDFTFRTYAPLAFRHFRDTFGISSAEFTTSLCNESLRELGNPGASGEHLYLTSDDKFFLKTVSSKEAEFLQKILPGLYKNLQQNPQTLLTKYYGMFAYQAGQKKIRLVVMKNLFPSGVKMHLKFDLKGSTHGRKASAKERAKKSPTFKDLDFLDMVPEGFQIDPETYTALMSTLENDCSLLESNNNMDYSLLLGVHNLDKASRELNGRDQEEKSLFQPNSTTSATHSTFQNGIPATNSKGERLLIFVGIIDILQYYRLFKKIEHTFKSVITDGDTVSVVEPGFYAIRFKEFMSTKVFRKNSSR